MPRRKRPEHSRRNATRSRWLGSMLACTLNTKPVTAFSSGLHRALRRLARPRPRRPRGQAIQQLRHAEVAQRAAEEHRRQVSLQERRRGRTRAARCAPARDPSSARAAMSPSTPGIARMSSSALSCSARSNGAVALRARQQHALAQRIEAALELAAHADRPGHRHHVEREPRGDLVEQRQRVLALAVDLVDEGDDRDIAQPAHLEQLARLVLDALGRVDHHHGRIDGAQRAVGVLAEVGVTRRIEQVENRAVALEGHHRAGHRDAARLLDGHPVRARAPPLAARPHVAGELDGAAEQQQLLRQRSFTGVRMGDDGERAAARDLALGRIERRSRGGRNLLHLS